MITNSAPVERTPPESRSRPVGVYVHFPWCLKKCPYCDFLSIAVNGSGKPPAASEARASLPHASYADTVLAELRARLRAWHRSGPLRSVFFGGGTPSLWDAAELGRVLAAIRESCASSPSDAADTPPGATAKASSDIEVTVECNPTSFDTDHARRLLDVGVNRVSIGVQGLEAERLEFLGRLHDAPGGLRALEDAQRAGVPRINADLIFGVARQSPHQAAAEARRVAEAGVTHVSAYALTIEPGTKFGAMARQGRLPLLDDALVAESFAAVRETLQSLGFEHYEISNYARDGHYAAHNLGYWYGEDYLGLGTGAWGTVLATPRRASSSSNAGAPPPTVTCSERVRYRNVVSPERYAEIWNVGDPPFEPFEPGAHHNAHEAISAEIALSERLLLGLRLAEGLDLEMAANELGVDPWPLERRRAADRLLSRGRLEIVSGRLRIPADAWLFADGTIAELL